MSVHQIATGFKATWRAAAHTQKCKPGCAKTMHQHSKTFATESEATRWDDKMRSHVKVARELADPVGILAPRPGSVRSFRAIALDTIADMGDRGQWATSTCTLRRTALGKLGSWADQPITSASQDIRGAQAVISGITHPDAALSLIKRTMDRAVREGDITSHAMTALKADRARVPDCKREFIFATADQLAIVCKTLDAWRPGLGLALLLMRWCGLRTGEALALEPGDFRDGYSVLRVSRQVGKRGLTTLKSKHADTFRDVPVPVFLRPVIREHVMSLAGFRMFASSRGTYVGRDMFGKKVREGADLAGLDAAWVAYQCRHQYASELISKRLPIDRVARLLGHSSTAITYKIYSHWMPGEFDDVLSLLDAA